MTPDQWRDHITRQLDELRQMVEVVLSRLLRIEHTLEIHIMADLSRISQEVSENTSATQSAITLLNQLSDLIRQNATDPAALNALADQLDANSNALADAVVANTPAAEEPTEPEPPTEG